MENQMADFRISIGNHDDVVTAVAVVGRCKVAATRSSGDAASTVYVQMGDHQESAGQVADYRHDTTLMAEQNDCRAVVSGYHDEGQWHQHVRVIEGEINESRVREIVRERVAHREKIESAKRAAESRAESARREAEKKAEVAMQRTAALAAAEGWAPGRVSVWQGNDRRWYAGRWDEPFIPGSGAPTEKRQVIVTDMRRFEGEKASFSARLA